jgi:hypothetical protein
VLVALAAAACFAMPASAGRGLIVGVDDDSLKWGSRLQAATTLSAFHDLSLRAIRITAPWHDGEVRPTLTETRVLDRALTGIPGSGGVRFVLAVYGRPDEAPRTEIDRASYCMYVGNLLRRYPNVRDVVIWNEPNSPVFWRPQYSPDGSDSAAAGYEALLARCWDYLHALYPSINVIAASSPHGNDRTSHSPVTWYHQLGDAYRGSGRSRPIFDTLGHNAYPNNSAERPWIQHASNAIGQGDYDKLVQSYTEAFAGTAQPALGQGVTIWYMETGFQTTIEFGKQRLYNGRETDRYALQPWTARSTASVRGPAPDQATQLVDAVRLAYCQPYVGAFFNFELADEPGLGGWQSGVLWTDLTPKPSYAYFKRAVAQVNAGAVDCNGLMTLVKQALNPVFKVIPGPGKSTGSTGGKARRKPIPVVTVK